MARYTRSLGGKYLKLYHNRMSFDFNSSFCLFLGMTEIDDKLKAGANALKKKIDDTSRDLRTEYEKEKIKEKVDDDSREMGERLDDAADKTEAGARAVANKLRETTRDLKTEYEKEKLKRID